MFQPSETSRSIDVTYSIEQAEFTEQVTWNNADATVTLTRRPPAVTVVNQTGHTVVLTAPTPASIVNDARTQFLVPETNRRIDVIYTIGQVEFTEQVTVSNADVTVTLTRRPPTVTVVNQTGRGRTVVLTAPTSAHLANGERTQFLAPLVTGNFGINYSSGLMQLTEQVTMRNQDVTVNLTGAPTLTIVNNTGTGNNVNIIQFRTPGSVAWIGGNIVITEDDEFYLDTGEALTGVTTQVLTNGEGLSFWLGNLPLSGNAFDIRLQTPGGVIFQRDNVQILRNMDLIFTSAHRR
jgi:hypothetical protein